MNKAVQYRPNNQIYMTKTRSWLTGGLMFMVEKAWWFKA